MKPGVCQRPDGQQALLVTASTMRMVLNSTRWKRNGSSSRLFMFPAMASWWVSTSGTDWKNSEMAVHAGAWHPG